MPSVKRILAVTAGLSVVGAVMGGVLGALLVVLLSARVSQFGHFGETLGWGAGFGAAMGFVLAPIAAWTLMRHVPIWRAMSETALGTIVGAGVGLILQPMHDVAWLSPVWLGIAGFGLAGLRLRLATRRRAKTSSAHGPDSKR